MLSTQTFFPKLFQTSQLCQTTTALQTPAPQRLVFTDETIISLSPQQQLWNSTYKLKTGSSITRRALRIEDQPEQTLLSFCALQPAHLGLCHTQLSSARLPGACFCSASPGHQGRAIQGCSAGPGLWLLLGPHACTWLCPSRAFPDQLWSSLAPSQKQSTISRRFHGLGGSGEPGRCRSGWLDGNGKATREQGVMPALGQPGWWVPWAVSPKSPHNPEQGQRVRVFGSCTEEHWTQVSRRI